MTTTTITLRVPPARLERINARAKAAGLTRSQYVINRADPEGAPSRVTTPENMAAPTVGCTHPRDRRRLCTWGAICDACGKRIR